MVVLLLNSKPADTKSWVSTESGSGWIPEGEGSPLTDITETQFGLRKMRVTSARSLRSRVKRKLCWVSHPDATYQKSERIY